ncbi:MAG TPA: anti-sigma factor domain-containing protein, partial [Spirochaetia bacterium]|nr:anti-sigma factor domain-containing protein [Spirochaetia bacterium]
MALETGVVLKTSGSRCMVLTPQGEFRTVPRTQGTVSVGQEIQFAWPAAQTQWRLLLAAASLFVILMAGTLFASIFPAAGYVSVDINPSIELGMNAWGRVVRAQGLNGDGQNLLQSLPLYGRPLDQALDNIAQKAVAMHYLKQGDQNNLMMITYTPGRLALAQLRREDAYQALAAQLKAEQTPAKLLFADMTPAQRHQAQQMGLSAGKYLVWERLMNRGVNISAQQMAQTSIAKLLLAEKMQVDAIMGPNTTYREVQPEGIASSGRTGSGMSPAGRTGAGITSSGRTGSGMAVKPGARVVPAMPS